MRFVMRIQVKCDPFTVISFRQSEKSKSFGLYMTSQCVSVGKTTETHEVIYIADTLIPDEIIEDIITNFDEALRVLSVEVVEYEE